LEEGIVATPPIQIADVSTRTPLTIEAPAARTLLLIWTAGTLIGLGWLALQLFRLIALKRVSVPPDGRLGRIWDSVVASTGTRRRVRLLVSQHSRLPAACGYLRPAIVTPEALCRALNEEETRHLLLHELAHLSRYDDWGLLAHRVVQAFCWWHPIVWYIGGRLDVERELACDETVVKASGRRVYARTLVRVAEVARGDTVVLAPGVLRGELTRRVESLMEIGIRRPGFGSRVGAGAAALSVAALGFWVSPPAIRMHASDAGQAPSPIFAGAAIASRLDSVFTSYVDSGFSGSILLALGDSVVLSRGYGWADREHGIPATAETRYSVAGFTKMFTAAAILTLEDEGRLRVVDSLSRFVGRLPAADGEVTLHQLLTHTDGLTRQNAPVYRSDPGAFLRAVVATPDTFDPGKGYRYNDFGHSVLGVIIERVSGSSYETFIRDRFLQPAGLFATGFENDLSGQPYAIEYAGPAGRQHPIPPRSYTWGRRASLGMVSTVGDMFRWIQAIRDPRVVSTRVRDRMLTPHGLTDWDAERGYGWDRIRRRDGSVLWRRVAGTPGMEGEILHDPVRGWTAVILVNSRVEWRFRVWDDIADAIRWNSVTAPEE
jgi:CubicO group peptidase (beta-lactamase class C family)